MRPQLSCDRQRFYHLMSLVCEDLPSKSVDTLVRKGHKANTEQLRAVRQCRKVHLPWLIDLVKVGLPTYKIPDELLPQEIYESDSEPASLFSETPSL
jgi:hypothetical protein